MLVKSPQLAYHVSNLKKTLFIFRIYLTKLNPFKCAFSVSLGKFLRFITILRGIEINPKKHYYNPQPEGIKNHWRYIILEWETHCASWLS